jgi:hypothetical protein
MSNACMSRVAWPRLAFLSFVVLSSARLTSFAAPALAQTHADKLGTVISAVAPIYLYNSAGVGQYALSVSSPTSLTVPSGATMAQICVETAAVRYRDDGTAPTSSVGVPVGAGTCFSYAGPLTVIQFIAQAGSPTIDVSYYKEN